MRITIVQGAFLPVPPLRDGAIESAIIDEVPDCAEKVCCIPYPLSDAPRSVSNVPAPRQPHLLFAGRIHPEKGVHLLVEAMVRLQTVVAAEWKLRLVGPWETSGGGGGRSYWDELKRIAAPVRGSVEFVGPLFDPAQLADCYRAASLFVYPSLAEKGETFGVAPLEAMSHGRPAVGSSLACFRDFVRGNENSFVFDHRAPLPAAELASKLVDLLSHPARVEEVRPHAASTAQSFSLERIADLYLGDFASLVEAIKPMKPAAGTASPP